MRILGGSWNSNSDNHTSRISGSNNRDDGGIHTSSGNDSSTNKLSDSWNMTSSKNDNDKPLLPKSTILKALAEAVRSYPSVGVIISEYTYQPQPNTLIRKAQPALAFILDNLLPSTEQNPDRECSSGARMLISALSAATDSQVTQYTVVTEVRAAILRALSWPEIPEKHQQLQLLTALIPTMIENCPPENPALMRIQQNQPRRNDIYNIMVRKGLISDLANITQSLDLSSPHTIVTIGTALKSLEQLLRMSNQPAAPVSLQFNKNRRTDSDNNPINSENVMLNENAEEVINDQSVFDDNTANDEQANNLNDDGAEDDVANLNDAPNAIGAEIEANAQMAGIETPTNTNNTNEPSQDAPEYSELENFFELIDDVAQRSTMADRASRGSSSVVAADNSTGGTGGLQPIDMADERFIIEEDDTSSDSDSNGSEENEEEREEESNGEDENEDEAEDRSDLEVDEETRQFIEMYDVYGRHLSPSIPELERDSEDILMIQYADNGENTNRENSNRENSNRDNANREIANRDNANRENSNRENAAPNENSGSSRFLFPNIFEPAQLTRHEEGVSANGDASNESGTGSPSASNVIGRIHITTSNSRSGGIGSGGGQSNSLSQLIQFRTQRTNRQRRCAYLNLNGRSTNQPAILQRLLGPVAQNMNIGLGQVIANANGSASFRDATRVVVMDNGFGILSNTNDPSIDLVDQAGYLFGRSLAATLNNTPSPLHWWLEEAKALGIESQADVCLTVCNELIPELEAQRSMELSKTRSKRKKKSPGDNASKQGQSQKQKNSPNQNSSSGETVPFLFTRDGVSIPSSVNETASNDAEATENRENTENNAALPHEVDSNRENVNYDSDECEVDDDESNGKHIHLLTNFLNS